MSPSDLGVFVLGTRGVVVNEAGGTSTAKGNTETVVIQTVCTGARNLRVLTRVSLLPLPQWPTLQGCMTVVLMTEYDNTEQVSGQCARASGALARVRRACLWRAQRAFATPLPQGGAKARSRTLYTPLTILHTSQTRSRTLYTPLTATPLPQGGAKARSRTLYTPLTIYATPLPQGGAKARSRTLYTPLTMVAHSTHLSPFQYPTS